MAKFITLSTNNLSLDSVWQWAKRLIDDLNKATAAANDTFGSVIPAGSVQMYAGPVAPLGWLIATGQSVSKAEYPNLFIAIGYTWGGNGETFYLPNFSDKFLIGAGGTLALGASGGAATASFQTRALTSLDDITASGVSRVLTATVSDDGSGVQKEVVDTLPPAVGINVIIKY
jgi:hypothetical protein